MKARLLKVTDGDTLFLAVRVAESPGLAQHLGFNLFRIDGHVELHAPFRLAGCNAWERGTIPGKAATAFLRNFLPVGTELEIRSYGADKFARFTASITTPNGRDLVAQLIEEQWAVRWNGKGLRPVPPWPRHPDW